MNKTIGILLFVVSTLSISNAMLIVYKSLILNETARANLENVINNVDSLEKNHLITLVQSLASSNETDYEVYILVGEQFRIELSRT